MDKKIAVLGVGAIGGSVGADLIEGGYDITLIDQWPAHIEAMKANGLRVVMPDREVQVAVRACHLCDVCTLNHEFDIVLLSCKSYDSCWMAELIKPYLKADGVLVSVQNSLNDEWISPIIGSDRDVGCVVELSAEIFTPGLIQRNTPRAGTWFGLGELDGSMTPRLRALEQMMSSAGTVSVTANIWGAKWSKLINSTMIMPLTGVLGLNSCEAADREVFDFCLKLGRESMAVARALGYDPEAIMGLTAQDAAGPVDAVLEKNIRKIISVVGKKGRGVILQEYLKGRRMETEHFNGVVVNKGRQANVATPANAAIVEISGRIRQGQLKPQRSNLELVASMLR